MHFNLLPWRAQRDRYRQHRFYGWVVVVGVLIGFVQLWVFSHLQATAEQQGVQLAKQQAQLLRHEAALHLSNTKQEQAWVTDDEMKVARQTLDALQQSSEPVGDWLVDLMAIRPPGVWIDHLNVSPVWAVFEGEGVDDPSSGSGHWQVALSGEVVLEADGLRYQAALAERFGRHQARDHNGHNNRHYNRNNNLDNNLDQKDVVDGSAADPSVPIQHPGLETFAIEQWVRIETP